MCNHSLRIQYLSINSLIEKGTWPALVLLFACLPAYAIDTDRPDVQRFIDRMVETHSYDRARLASVLAEAESKESILEAISRPAERTMEWHDYRDIFITSERIAAGAAFWQEHEADLRKISESTGVSVEILVGIIGVETYFGRITGNFRVLDALATLAFDYPPRSKFFTSELEHFLLLVREEGMEATDATGSYAGAMGRPQFMPSSYRAYAVDSTDDGKRDIWTNWVDVIGSVANYFVRHDWVADNPVVTTATLGTQWSGETPDNILKAEETTAMKDIKWSILTEVIDASDMTKFSPTEILDAIERRQSLLTTSEVKAASDLLLNYRKIVDDPFHARKPKYSLDRPSIFDLVSYEEGTGEYFLNLGFVETD